MKRQIYTIIAIATFTTLQSQNCVDKSLSKNFDYEISLKSNDQKDLGAAEIQVAIINKISKEKIQTLVVESEFILKSVSFKNCLNNKTYKPNVSTMTHDNDFGDLINADFNFDGKEDIAIKREEGGNGGVSYNFYLQSSNQEFVLDKYLSSEMTYFPFLINAKNQTLVVTARIDSLHEEIITYEYSNSSKSWKIKKRKQL